ncbi:MAG: DUF3450 family protein [Akkermansiaceae bacterium]
MKRLSPYFFAFSLLMLPASGQVEANKKLRTSVQKWIAVMQQTTQTQKDWEERKQLLAESKETLGAEIKDVESDIEATQARLKTADTDSSKKLEEKRDFDAAREALQKNLDAVEGKVSAVIPTLPPELAGEPKMAKAILDHKNFVAAEDKSKKLNGRLGAMVNILNITEKFNQIVSTYEDSTAKAGDKEVEIDKVYFGLAFGFAANEDGTVAFRLTPGPEGWTETLVSDADLAARIRELIDVASGSGETRLVDLPLEIAP